MALRINFVPHHSPVLIMFDERGGERENIDIAGFNFQGLQELMESKGFKRKELL